MAQLHTVTSSLPNVHWKINVPITTFKDYKGVESGCQNICYLDDSNKEILKKSFREKKCD